MNAINEIKKTSRPAWIAEVLFCATAFGVIFVVSLAYTRSLRDPLEHPMPFQMVLSYPAVFYAAGHGFGVAEVESIPGLADFIGRRTATFDTANIPDDLVLSPMSTAWELTHIYHIYAVGLIWRLLGVSVDALMVLAALLAALSAAVSYLLFRLGMGRLASLAGALLVFTSPAMLMMVNVLREYGKTPFFLGVIAILIALAAKPVSRHKLLALAALLGLWLGIGLGFRQDLLICLPPAVTVLLFFSRPEAPHGLRWRIAATLVFLAIFMPLARPVFRGMALEGSQVTVHTFFQGLAQQVEGAMAFGGASYVNHGPKDNEVYAQINTFARRSGGYVPVQEPGTAEYRRQQGDPVAPPVPDPGLLYMGPEYARYGRELMGEMVWTFPADLVARAWTTVTAVHRMPDELYEEMEKVDAVFPRWLAYLIRCHGSLARHLGRHGLLYMFALLAAVSTKRFRLALCMTGLLLWFSGYPSLLFAHRNLFHVAFIPFGAWIFWIDRAGATLIAATSAEGRRGIRERTCEPRRALGAAGRVLAYSTLLIAAIVLPLAALRSWQIVRVHALARELGAARLEPLRARMTTENERMLIRPEAPVPGLDPETPLDAGETAWSYVAAVFDTHGRDIPVWIDYDRDRFLHDFSQEITVYGGDEDAAGRVVLFFPVYDTSLYTLESFLSFIEGVQTPQLRAVFDDPRPHEAQAWWRRSKFLGLSFPKEYKPFFVGFYHVLDIQDIHILITFQVPEDRDRIRAYKTGPWERKARAGAAQVFSWMGCRDSAGKGDVQGRLTRDGEDAALYDPTSEDAHPLWMLDEMLLRHQWPSSFPGLLLRPNDADAYIEAWRERLAYLPDMAGVAAEDLARAGAQWLKEDRPQEALQAYRAAVEMDGDTALYILRLGQLHLLLNNDADALRCFREALQWEPLLPATVEKADELLVSSGDREGRIRFWRELFERHGPQWLIGMRLGAALEAAEDIPGARDIYSQVYDAYPDHPDTRLALARCLGRMGERDKATAIIEETLASHPDFGPLVASQLLDLGNYHETRQEWRYAEEAFRDATRYDPLNPWALIRLGDLYLREGRGTAALEAYRLALERTRGDHESFQPMVRNKIAELEQRVAP